jgi:5'-nucleotidase
MPHLLLTNDDGVTAPGLLALAQALRAIAEVTVFAPDRNWSASGHQKTLHRPLKVNRVTLADGTPALSTDGAPADCVALALMGVVEKPVDLVVSGINPWPNLSLDMLYSGTVSAAVEAVINGVPGIAVSTNHPEQHEAERDYRTAAAVACQIAARALANGHARDLLLNVNVPHLPAAELRGWQITRQGTRIYQDELLTNRDPYGRPYYWIGGKFPDGVNEPGTDIGALRAGYVSITPLQLDRTHHAARAQLLAEGWEQ